MITIPLSALLVTPHSKTSQKTLGHSRPPQKSIIATTYTHLRNFYVKRRQYNSVNCCTAALPNTEEDRLAAIFAFAPHSVTGTSTRYRTSESTVARIDLRLSLVSLYLQPSRSC